MGTSKDHSERLEVRSMWQDEALDFTPWLACNLDSIGKVIGKNLEFIEREKKVGPFLLLDILAKETDTGKAVAIENQLEWSDTDIWADSLPMQRMSMLVSPFGLHRNSCTSMLRF